MTIRHAAWRRANKPVRNEPPSYPEAPPAEDTHGSPEEMAEIERILEQMEDGECEMGCDYPEGPMSPTGCEW